MDLIIIFTVIAIMIIFDFIPTVKKKQAREIVAYSVLIVLILGIYSLKLFIAPDMNSISNSITEFVDKVFNIK